MKKRNIAFEVAVYNNLEELSKQDANLMQKAILARKDAYAPYSGFKVGAALLLANNEVVIGSNQENASYPAGLCAERVAIFSAGANFPGISVVSIAITAKSSNHLVDKPVAPCGSCRQVIAEYEFKQKKPIELLLMGESGEVIKCSSLADILPLGFNSSYL